MPPAERERLLAMLGERPIAAEPVRPPPLGASAALAVGLVLSTFEVFVGWPLAWTELEPLALGAAIATVCAAAIGVLGALLAGSLFDRLKIARSPLAQGKFLHAFGYVEVHGDHVRLVPGTAIERIAVDVGAPGPTGASRITVSVVSGPFHGSVAFDGLDIDVPPDRLDDVLRARWGDDSYRGGSAPFSAPEVAQPPRAARWQRVALTTFAGLAAAAAGYGWALPSAALSEHPMTLAQVESVAAVFPLPWVRAEVAARREALFASVADALGEVDEPFGAELRALLEAARRDDGVAVERMDDGHCHWTEDDARRIDQYVTERSAGADLEHFPLASFPPADRGWYRGLVDALVPLAEDGGARVRLSTRCVLRPTSVAFHGDGSAYAQIEVDVTIAMAVEGRAPVEVSETLRHPILGEPIGWAYVPWVDWLWPAVAWLGVERAGPPERADPRAMFHPH